jgi:hypothetical protein
MTQNFNLKNKFDMEHKTSTIHENGNDANRLLPAAALWWRNLTAKQKAYMWDKYYDDHEITNERINERYEYDKRLSAEHAIDPNRF